MSAIVAVHAGAGFHSASIRKDTLALCQDACLSAQSSFKLSPNPLDACVSAMRHLEDSELTNAGRGSNLTLLETVECDAGIAHSKNCTFGGIGAVPNIRNPTVLASHVLQAQWNPPKGGLVPPSLLVGQEALHFARACDIEPCKLDLVTARSIENFRKALRNEKHKAALDTVGCVVLSPDGAVCSACSSGGLLLKQPGRVGHAPQFGCGCWAEERAHCSVGVSVSGCGELLVRTQFARNCAKWLIDSKDDLKAECLDQFFRTQFMQSEMLASAFEDHKLAGAVVLFYDKIENEAEVLWVHNTRNMALGWSDAQVTKSVMSELPLGSKLVVQGYKVQF